MDKQLKSEFAFDDYNVNYVQFMANPKYKEDGPIELDFNIAVEIGINEELATGKVTLIIDIFEDAEKNNFPFSISLSITGFFSAINKEISEKELGNFCKVNGTAILFPYLRSIVSEVTKAANVEPLTLPLINVYRLIEHKQKHMDENK